MTAAPTAFIGCAGMGGLTLGAIAAGFRVVGAVDIDPAVCRDHETLTGVPCTEGDIAQHEPEDWRRICPRTPDVFAWSPPCQGFSGCLPEAHSQRPQYRRLNALAQWGIYLALSAWPTPPPIILLENVPRIQSRGRAILDSIVDLLEQAGYVVAETSHDCGELGGLAQRRRRFLLVARHKRQVQEFLYEPPRRRVRGVGEVLGELPVPLPGSTAGGPMHRLPRLSALNWLRLALIPAGGDWRDLPPSVALPVSATRHDGAYGVETWDTPAHAVVGDGTVRNTWSSVADVRVQPEPRNGAYGVADWSSEAATVLASSCHDNAAASVADPRSTCRRREGSIGVTSWDAPSTAVIGMGIVQNGPWQVADPRLGLSDTRHSGRFGVEGWEGVSHTVTGDNTRVGCGWASAVTDPRLTHEPHPGSWHVSGWAEPSRCVIASQKTGGTDQVADPRVPAIVGAPFDIADRSPIHLVIRASDGTWHRPMTTLELAALQGFPVELADGPLVLDGRSHAAWRKRIGNAVPPPAAHAIFASMARTLSAAREQGLLMSGEPVWVRGILEEAAR